MQLNSESVLKGAERAPNRSLFMLWVILMKKSTVR